MVDALHRSGIPDMAKKLLGVDDAGRGGAHGSRRSFAGASADDAEQIPEDAVRMLKK